MHTLLPHISLETGNSPKHSIIWLHGLGADGNDFVPIIQEIKLPVPVRYIFPDAPMRPITINGGFVMRAWYDITEPNTKGPQDADGINNSQASIEALIEQEVLRGIPHHKIFLAGFSQGGAIVLHTVLRQSTPLGGVIALSTYLPLAEHAKLAMTPTATITPIFMAHGYKDNVLPFSLGVKSRDFLQELNCKLTWHEYDMTHSVCPQEINDISAWLTTQIHSTSSE